MAVVTITGLRGSGAPEVGAEVARILNADYIDRLVLAEAAKRIGATVEAVAAKSERPQGRRDRLAQFIQTLLERSAAAGTGGDPYFGPGLEVLLGRDYTEIPSEPITRAQEIEDSRFIEVTRAVIQELAHEGHAVFIGRGHNIILKDTPGALHVGLVAPLEARVRLIMERGGLDEKGAEKHIVEFDRARIAYFKKFFNVHPDDPLSYHMILNVGMLPRPMAAQIICQAAAEQSG